jgi:hypothetical protein
MTPACQRQVEKTHVFIPILPERPRVMGDLIWVAGLIWSDMLQGPDYQDAGYATFEHPACA